MALTILTFCLISAILSILNFKSRQKKNPERLQYSSHYNFALIIKACLSTPEMCNEQSTQKM